MTGFKRTAEPSKLERLFKRSDVGILSFDAETCLFRKKRVLKPKCWKCSRKFVETFTS